MAKSSHIVLTSIVALAVLTAAGCVNSATPSPSPSPAPSGAPVLFERTTWTLTSFVTEGGTTNVLPNTTITITFSGGNATGSAGCNGYFAHYELSGHNITITSLGSTLMYCTNPGVMTQETTYVQLLQNIAAYAISADTLSLVNGAGQVQLVFRAVNATA